MKKEYYQKYRPRALEDVLGQEAAVASIQRLIKQDEVPHSILLTGPSGTGKTTIARILGNVIGCHKSCFHECDCTRIEKPLDFVRDIAQRCHLSPLHGKITVWFLEEFQSLARAGFSQQALLKLLEDAPEHVYFILATTDPQKVNKAILTRCSEIKLTSLKPDVLSELLSNVIKREKIEVSDEVADEIIQVSEGSARKALVILQQISRIEGDEEQIKAIQVTTANKEDSIVLCRKLINPGSKWPEVAALLKEMKDSDVETIRHQMLGYASAVLLGGGKLSARAFTIIDIFSRPFYDSKHPGLVAACYEVVMKA